MRLRHQQLDRGIWDDLAADLGVFVRAGANDLNKEACGFTEINKSVSARLS